MKGITKRKDGRYMIRKVINGNMILKYARTKQEAIDIYRKIKKGKIKYKKPKKQSTVKTYTFDKWIDEWMELYKKPFLSPKSYNDIKCYIKMMQNEFRDVKLKDMNTNQIQMYLNTIPRSRKKDRITLYLNASLQKATDIGIIKRNPFNAVQKDKKSNNRNTAYTYDEQVKILNAVKNTDIELEIYIYLLCGCRPNELPNKENFDFEKNIINIYGTKTENSKHRQIEMSENFAKYIKLSFEKNEIHPVKYISKKFISICKELNIQKPLLYRLRHTFATNHFQIGTNAKYVQHWLGHGSIAVTMDVYTDIDKTLTKENIQKLYNNFYYEI